MEIGKISWVNRHCPLFCRTGMSLAAESNRAFSSGEAFASQLSWFSSWKGKKRGLDQTRFKIYLFFPFLIKINTWKIQLSSKEIFRSVHTNVLHSRPFWEMKDCRNASLKRWGESRCFSSDSPRWGLRGGGTRWGDGDSPPPHLEAPQILWERRGLRGSSHRAFPLPVVWVLRRGENPCPSALLWDGQLKSWPWDQWVLQGIWHCQQHPKCLRT